MLNLTFKRVPPIWRPFRATQVTARGKTGQRWMSTRKGKKWACTMKDNDFYGQKKNNLKSIAVRTIALHITNIYGICVFSRCFSFLLARYILLAALRMHTEMLQRSAERKTNKNERSPTEKEKYFHIGLAHTKNVVMQSSRKGFAPKTTPLNSPWATTTPIQWQYNGSSVPHIRYAHTSLETSS